LGNGAEADPRDWPASFFAHSSGGSCTATLVGPQSLLTAAHCVADNGRVQFRRRGTDFAGTCRRPSPGFPAIISHDWAMCLMDTVVPAHRYERVSFDLGLLRRDGQLLLAGYGCTNVGGVSDGKFRIGPAFIARLPSQQGNEGDWITTHAAKLRGDAFICEGDSGGAVFVEQPAADRRLIVAVNSHRDAAGQGVSFLSAMGTVAGRRFITSWQAANRERRDQNGRVVVSDVRICGIDSDAPNCR
jgi:hypothetical protein